jgi:hypothetical protein
MCMPLPAIAKGSTPQCGHEPAAVAVAEYETHYAAGEATSKNIGGRLNGLAFGRNGARIATAFEVLRERAQA